MAQFRIQSQNIAAALDVGSLSLRALSAVKNADGSFEPLSYIEEESLGLQQGRVLDFRLAGESLARALSSLELASKASFSSLWVGISCPFHSFNSHGMAALPFREVRGKDMELVLETACAVPLPDHHAPLHVRSQGFSVDGRPKTTSPIGLSGLRLETQARIVTAHTSYQKDLLKAFSLTGFQPKGFLHNLIAFAENSLVEEQKNEGVCFCDIGSTAAQGIVYQEGRIQSMFEIPIGGAKFSRDLADRFKIPFHVADRLKKRHGGFLSHGISLEEQIEVPEEELFLSRRIFVETLEKTAEKLFFALKARWKEQKTRLRSGLVFTGALAFTPGFAAFAGRFFPPPLRLNFSIHEEKNFSFGFRQKNTLSVLKEAYRMKLLQEAPVRSPWSRLKELF